jgi:hypothetical protein
MKADEAGCAGDKNSFRFQGSPQSARSQAVVQKPALGGSGVRPS